MKLRVIWASLVVAVLFGASAATSPYCGSVAWAGSACQAKCDRAFAECYNSSGGDRSACAAKRARCLNACLG